MIKLSVWLVLAALACPVAAEQLLFTIDKARILETALRATHEKHPDISQGDLVPQYFLQIHCNADEQQVDNINELQCTADVLLMVQSTLSKPVIERDHTGTCMTITRYQQFIVFVFQDGSTDVSEKRLSKRSQGVECPDVEAETSEDWRHKPKGRESVECGELTSAHP